MWTLQDAKNRFSSVVDAALAGVPQKVTRRGKPAVVVVSDAEFTELLKAARQARPSFAEHLLLYPASEIDRSDVKPRDVAF
jgi:antitoxin Phd